MKSMNRTYNARRESGLCAMCGKVPTENFRCDDCNAKNSARSRASRYKNAAEGLCFQCGGSKGDRTTLRCAECTAKAARAYHRKALNHG